MARQKISYNCLMECLKQSKNNLWLIRGDVTHHKVVLNKETEFIAIDSINIDSLSWDQSGAWSEVFVNNVYKTALNLYPKEVFMDRL